MIPRLIFASLIALAAAAAPASAQDRRVPASPTELRMSYAPVVQKAAPSVVNVYAAKIVENRNPFMDDPFFRRFFGGGGGGMPREQVQRSLGSGVIVDGSGLVMTNNHVIEGASEVKIALADKREFEAEVLLKDARTDLAVLRSRTAREKFTAIDLGNSDELQVGDVVLAVGNPFGVGQTVTHGIVSALARTQVGITDYQFFIQTDAAINPGNSGGALVDLAGRLVGLNTAIFSRSGGSQGIGFAIPVNMVKVVIASAKSGGTTVRRPWLGAKLQNVTPDIAESLGLKRPVGALVATVTDKSPASRARAEDRRPDRGDRRADGRRPERVRLPLRHQAARRQRAARRRARRQGDQAHHRARDRAGDAARGDRHPGALALHGREDREHLAGARRRAAARGLGRRRGRARRRATARPAQSLGFQRGDVIAQVNDEKIARTRDLDRVSKERQRPWRITIVRGGQSISVTFGG